MFKEQFTTFNQNIHFAARTLHRYLVIGKRAIDDSEFYNTLNHNARIWNDFNYMSLQTVIIFLGKIFDRNQKSFSVEGLFKEIEEDLHHFSKEELRKRKVALGGFSNMDEYIDRAHELNTADLHDLQILYSQAKDMWQSIKPLRDKIYAHNDIVTREERNDMFRKVTYSDLEAVIQTLLNISEMIEQAEMNGRAPDFGYNHYGPIQRAREEAETFISSLLHST